MPTTSYARRAIGIVGILICFYGLYYLACVYEPAPSAVGKTPAAVPSPNVSRNPLEAPTEEECADLIDRLLPYVTQEGFTPANQDKIAALFTEGMGRGADPHLMLIYLQFRMVRSKSQYNVGYYYGVTFLELSLGKKRQPTEDDVREATPVGDYYLLFKISRDDKTVTVNGTRRLAAVRYEPRPARR